MRSSPAWAAANASGTSAVMPHRRRPMVARKRQRGRHVLDVDQIGTPLQEAIVRATRRNRWYPRPVRTIATSSSRRSTDCAARATGAILIEVVAGPTTVQTPWRSSAVARAAATRRATTAVGSAAPMPST